MDAKTNWFIRGINGKVHPSGKKNFKWPRKVKSCLFFTWRNNWKSRSSKIERWILFHWWISRFRQTGKPNVQRRFQYARKISKIQKGYADYFKGHDKVVNFLAKQVRLSKDLDSLTEINIDTIYYINLIRSSEIDILSRKPCHEYLVVPKNNQIILNFSIKKCDKELFVDELNFK